LFSVHASANTAGDDTTMGMLLAGQPWLAPAVSLMAPRDRVTRTRDGQLIEVSVVYAHMPSRICWTRRMPAHPRFARGRTGAVSGIALNLDERD